MDNVLPKDWKRVKLGDICERMSNGANVTQFEEKVGYPISRIETIWKETIDLNRVKYITEKEESFKVKYALQKDDILFSHINSDIHLGKTAIFKNQTATLIHGINLLLIRLKSDVSADFVNYQLKFNRKNGDFIRIAQKSVNQSSINQQKLKNIDIVLPPKLTQERIVSKIEELFSELDKGIENLRLAQQQLKTYQQAVLKWAFEGRLTNENVKEGELPEGWNWVKVRDICKVVRGGSPRPAGDPKYYIGNIPFLKVADLTKDEGMNLVTYSHTIKEAGLHKTRKINPNTLLLSNSGATLGVPKICMISATMNDGIAAFLELDERSIQYMYYFWKSKTKELRNINMGAAQPNLNTDIIKEYDVPFCSFEQQEKVVQEIECRLSVVDKMEDNTIQAMQYTEALRQSILKNAFEGKLTQNR